MSILTEIKQASELAAKHRKVTEKIGHWFIQRYGKHFSEVSCDPLIDAIDYGTGAAPTTIQQIDEIMLSYSGIKPLSSSKGGKSDE